MEIGRKFYDFKEVKISAKDRWVEIILSLGASTASLSGRHSPCPGCGGKDRFRFDNKNGEGTWLCSGKGDMKSGDGLGLIQHIKNIDWKEATDLVGEYLGLEPIVVGMGGKSSQRAESRHAAQPPPQQPASYRTSKRNEFDPSALASMMCRGFKPDYQWLAEISPIDVRKTTPAEYLNTILQPGEKTLVFYKFYSQGEYGFQAGDPGKMFRIGKRRSDKPVPVDHIDVSGREGAWYLPNPVNGKWYPTGRTDDAGNPLLSRRSGDSVTAYRYILVESDEADEGFWLNLICQLPLPITALYTSGGRSVHALVRIDAESKSEFDAIKERLSPLLSKLGADPGAFSGVRLTRIPGVLRDGTRNKEGDYIKYPTARLQRLLYLNPSPEVIPLRQLTRIREVEA